MLQDLIAVVDIGKTNAKLLLIEARTGDVTWSIEKRFAPLDRSPVRELDVAAFEAWLLAGLAQAPEKQRIRALVPVAHGAAAVLVSRTEGVLIAPDYEDPAFDDVRDSYRAERDPFDVTLSPFLPQGLNLGRQLYYLSRKRPDLLRSCDALLLYPQYWAWRFSRCMASEMTSLGCHSDLWRPRQARFSSLASTQGFERLLPPLRAAGDVLGTVTPEIAHSTGLDPTCRVLCGIHDSNASYLCHRVSRADDEQFAVVSSGTWIVIMAHGTDLDRLREERDMLANVDASGEPVATARFLGGREYEAIAGGTAIPGGTHGALQPTAAALRSVLSRGAMALARSDTANAGVQLVNAEGLDEVERAALATLYCSLQTDRLLDLLGLSGTVIVDGPLSANPLYLGLLRAYRAPAPVLGGDSRAGLAQCARYLCGNSPTLHLTQASPLECAGLTNYRNEWLSRVQPS